MIAVFLPPSSGVILTGCRNASSNLFHGSASDDLYSVNLVIPGRHPASTKTSSSWSLLTDRASHHRRLVPSRNYCVFSSALVSNNRITPSQARRHSGGLVRSWTDLRLVVSFSQPRLVSQTRPFWRCYVYSSIFGAFSAPTRYLLYIKFLISYSC